MLKSGKLIVLMLLLYSCDSPKADFDRLAKSQGIDLRKYIEPDSVVADYAKICVEFTALPGDKELEKQHALADLLPGVNLQLAKLYYYQLLLDTLAKPATGLRYTHQAAHSVNYKYLAALAAASSAIGSLALINANEQMVLGSASPGSFSYGGNPMALSIASLAITSSVASSVMAGQNEEDNSAGAPLDDSVLVAAIQCSFDYYHSFFELDDSLKDLRGNTLLAARLLNNDHIITTRSFISEQYFLDYLFMKKKITALELVKYKQLLAAVKKPITAKAIDFPTDSLLSQLRLSVAAITGDALLLQQRLSAMGAAGILNDVEARKINSLLREVKVRDYAGQMRRCNCADVFSLFQ